MYDVNRQLYTAVAFALLAGLAFTFAPSRAEAWRTLLVITGLVFLATSAVLAWDWLQDRAYYHDPEIRKLELYAHMTPAQLAIVSAPLLILNGDEDEWYLERGGTRVPASWVDDFLVSAQVRYAQDKTFPAIRHEGDGTVENQRQIAVRDWLRSKGHLAARPGQSDVWVSGSPLAVRGDLMGRA